MKANQIVTIVLAVLVGVLGTLLFTGRSMNPAAYAQESGSSGSVIALAGQRDETQSVAPVFIIDTKAMTLLCYNYNYQQGLLSFTYARTFRYDRLLPDWHFQGRRTSVQDVQKMIK